ncbi:MAG: HK97 family phage prohead protease [bacterium]|nr:HK97 family phage prohead protease [bacterium]
MNLSDQQSECERKFAPLDFKGINEDGSFEGYASLFGKKDISGDIVARGAFASSLQKRGPSGIRMLYQHDPSEPIGVWRDVIEDACGLFVRGQLLSQVAKSREILALMREGALDGLSIGFRTVRGKSDRNSGTRRLLEVDLWEISIVTFPMLQQARISSVKSSALPTMREFERWLVRDAGFTRSNARAVICSGFKNLASKRDAAGEGSELLADAMRRAAGMMKRKYNDRI